MPDMNEPYAYIEERITEMRDTAKNLHTEVVRMIERAETLEREASALHIALISQRKADEEAVKAEFDDD